MTYFFIAALLVWVISLEVRLNNSQKHVDALKTLYSNVKERLQFV